MNVLKIHVYVQIGPMKYFEEQSMTLTDLELQRTLISLTKPMGGSVEVVAMCFDFKRW